MAQRDNVYWLTVLVNNVWNGWAYGTGLTTAAPLLDALTPDRLRGAAWHYLNTARVVRIAIRPR